MKVYTNEVIDAAKDRNSKIDKKYEIKLTSLSATFLPAGVVAKVYARYMPEKKNSSIHSVHSFDSNKEQRLKDFLNR